MTKTIFRSTFLVASVVLIASIVFIIGCLYDYFGTVQEKQLKDELSLAVQGVEGNGEEYLKQLSSQRYRLTLIAKDGNVIYDTQVDSETMENHSDRKEVKEAMSDGEGSSSRYSSTLLQKTIYSAKKLNDGTILRISIKHATIGLLVLGMMHPIIFVLIIALVVSWVVSKRISRRIVEPLNKLNLDEPLKNETYDELAPLLGRINQQQKEIKNQLGEIKRSKDEFLQITGSMKEGLVLLDEEGVIISINKAAQIIFKTDSSCVNRDFITIERNHEVMTAIKQAAEQGHTEIFMERNGREYQIDITRIQSGNSIIGEVLLAFDITEQHAAEQRRKEFTANVTHELKTPLQSIMGCAELIENGLVKKEDLQSFVGNIRSESTRLFHLIDDIIKVSKMDEGCPIQFEDVNLYDISKDVALSLNSFSQSKGVSILFEGEPIIIKGSRQLLHDAIYNIVDNAIKYNVENGKVCIKVFNEGKRGVISVRDSGIGIPQEEQSRIFERFYRVDKSHSKETGGTGLGLSIVKHAVEYMHGEINVQSSAGNGSTITINFPIADN